MGSSTFEIPTYLLLRQGEGSSLEFNVTVNEINLHPSSWSFVFVSWLMLYVLTSQVRDF